jgi:hypothetical protein
MTTTTIFQLFVSGPRLIGHMGKFYSKKVFLSREDAEAYMPEFIAKCLDPKPLDALESVEITRIIELELEGKICP